MFHWKRWYQSVLLRAEFAERQLDIARKQRDAKIIENTHLRREISERAQPKGPGVVVDGLGHPQRVFVDGFKLRNVVSVTNVNTPDSLSETTIVLHHLPYRVREEPGARMGLRCPIDFSAHRPSCPLSWRLTAKAEAQYATSRISDWLGQGWTLEAMREYGFIEPIV